MNADRWSKFASLLLVLAFHGAMLYGAWSYKLIPPPKEAVTLFVNLINPPQPKKEEPLPESPKPPPQKVKLVKQQPVTQPKPEPLLVSSAPVTSATEPVAPMPEPEPLKIAPMPEPVVEAAQKPPVPIALSSDLSVSCPQRSMPNYPAISKRMNEQGSVVLRVELDEVGRIASARIATSSGFKRLDEAGLAALKSWQCNPSTRNGVAVRAVALQPFDFILEGR
jgi:protein TonB